MVRQCCIGSTATPWRQGANACTIHSRPHPVAHLARVPERHATLWLRLNLAGRFPATCTTSPLWRGSPCIEGNLEVKLPTYGQTQERWWEESEKRKSQRRERVERKSKWAKEPKKSRETLCFPMFSGSGGSAKAASAERKLSCCKSAAAVARSTFRSQNVKNTPRSDHFWKLRCWKAHASRGCGVKHISKSKC